MKQKKTYIRPSVRVVFIKGRPQLLAGSSLTAPKGIFVDIEASDFEWDEEGAN